jgi:hypothetical protein
MLPESEGLSMAIRGGANPGQEPLRGKFPDRGEAKLALDSGNPEMTSKCPPKTKSIMRISNSLLSALRLPLALSAALFFASHAFSAGNPKVPAGAKSSGGLHATIETDRGPIEFELYAADSPKAVENFRLLAEHGYYDGLKFHRIVKGFMIQGGDPAGNGSGGESAWGGTFADDAANSSSCTRITPCRQIM